MRSIVSAGVLAALTAILGLCAVIPVEARPNVRREGRLAFVTQRFELAVVSPDGRGFRRLTRSIRNIGAPQWSPDRRQVVFVQPNGLFIVSMDGRGLREIRRALWPAWSPDGTRLAFVDRSASPWPPLESLKAGRIVILDLRTGERHVVARGTTPAWSPSGDRLAFVRHTFSPVMRSYIAIGSDLYTIGANGSGKRLLLTGQTYGLIVYRPKWSPRADGTIATYGESETDGQTGVVLFRDGHQGATRLLAEHPQPGSDVEWSPDGSRLAFLQYPADPDSVASVIAVIDVATGRGNHLVQTGSRDIAWSPDGTRIAFARCARLSLSCQLRSVDVKTRRTRPIRPIYLVGWDWR